MDIDTYTAIAFCSSCLVCIIFFPLSIFLVKSSMMVTSKWGCYRLPAHSFCLVTTTPCMCISKHRAEWEEQEDVMEKGGEGSIALAFSFVWISGGGWRWDFPPLHRPMQKQSIQLSQRPPLLQSVWFRSANHPYSWDRIMKTMLSLLIVII